MYPTYAPVYDPTAVMGRRFGAWIIDFMLGAVLLFALFLSFAEQHEFATAARAQAYCDQINEGDEYACGQSEGTAFILKYDDLLIIGLVGLGYWVLNDAVLTGITGFSIGKGIVGLRVVRQNDGRLAGFGRAFARWGMWIADWVPFCVPVVGLATANSSNGHRRVGDMVAKTLVVDKHQVGTPPQVIGLTATGPGFPPAPGYPGGYPGGPGYRGPAGYPGTPAAPPWAGGPATPPPAPGQPPAWGAPTGAPGSAPPWTSPQPMPTPSSPPQPATPPWAAPEGSGPVWAPPPAAPSPAPTPAPWATPGQQPPASGGVDPTLVQPALWPEPPTQQIPVVESPPAVATGPGVDGPLWDDARDAYIQWDHEINRWVQWDERTREWHPL